MKTKLILLLTLSLTLMFQSNVLLADETMEDHRAQVFNFTGTVKVLKNAASDWIEVKKGMVIEAGDQLITAKESHVEIVYDDKFLNIAKIDENTKAEFRSIEPTVLFLEDGSIFNALDGLKGEYSVTTPTAIAAVRGTHFEVNYDAETKVMDTAVIPDTREHLSQLEVTPILENGEKGNSLLIDEGQQVNVNLQMLGSGQPLQPEVVDPSKVDKANTAMDEMLKGVDPSLRSEEKSEVKKDDDDNKKVGGNGNPPNSGDGGGGSGGSGSSNSAVQPNLLSSLPVSGLTQPQTLGAGALNSIPAPIPVPAGEPDKVFNANVDQLMDGLIPREDVPIDVPATGPDFQRVDPNQVPNDPLQQKNEPEAIANVKPDMGQMVSFFQLGGAFNGPATELPSNMTEIFNTWGVATEVQAPMDNLIQAMHKESISPGGFAPVRGEGPMMGGPESFSPGAFMFAGGPGGTAMMMPTTGFTGDFSPTSTMDNFDPTHFLTEIVQNPIDCTTSGACGTFAPLVTTELNPFQIFWSGGYIQDILLKLKNTVDQAGGTDTYWQNAYVEPAAYSGSYTGTSHLSTGITLNMTSITSGSGPGPVSVTYDFHDAYNSQTGTATCIDTGCTKN